MLHAVVIHYQLHSPRENKPYKAKLGSLTRVSDFYADATLTGPCVLRKVTSHSPLEMNVNKHCTVLSWDLK